jgi:hypothetical protein
MKFLIIALSGIRRELRGGVDGGDPTNIQCNNVCNCHNESLLYKKYVLIKMKKII